ncbi:hypothetical protein N7492_006111 [Penicillium capsulatum]|uniref:Uncharacterized protein n=1 Tax=Penicillium capsulatum TaxID=69766 RepID=A0A9W9I373_9EURO|nr:hypothetical protein N7492_006111 [Penicillium capsulatum]
MPAPLEQSVPPAQLRHLHARRDSSLTVRFGLDSSDHCASSPQNCLKNVQNAQTRDLAMSMSLRTGGTVPYEKGFASNLP